MRRGLHKLFPWLHKFEPYTLTDPAYVTPGNPIGLRVWYIGFRCTKCGDYGYQVPLGG
jgi:hypothetical protein